jgi:RNA polymerase sigma-70 factor (ECF subfamily)
MTVATADRKVEIADLVSEHQADVWRYLRFLGCDPSEAEDLAQEVFLEVIRRPFEHRSRQQSAAYLRRVARSRLLMLRRSQGRNPVQASLEKSESIWAATTEEDGSLEPYLDALRRCLEMAINDRQRRAVNMLYRHGESREQIAEALELTIEGVKTLLRRARGALRDCVKGKLAT